ncbi:VPS35 endosomal protein-sorting factor-like [Amphibalanus amphitrite]|uniref:VPS35 endosomal protein-sorting factor-like n=1 Tax=Amphibalanus amphitrite TaxID=1232801 RepID=UPI001C901DE5|nr:VPS35 endosomal protein-sorting factor-like [Amphibalanus amphitrite]
MEESNAENVKCYFRVKDYRAERTVPYAAKTDIHPLTSVNAGGVGGATSRPDGGASVGDPLTRLMEGSDPLSALAALDIAQEPEQAAPDRRSGAPADDWPARRRAILAQFTTSQLVTVTTRAGDAGADTVSARPASRSRARLAQLETDKDDAAGKEQFTQQEFIAHTGRLRKQLQQAWQADQRVRALKLVIQACKLLEEVGSAQFYPTVFVLVTDILDVFGTLVYNRVTTKDKEQGSPAAPPGGDLVTEAGRETCRNWFYKIASIRELVARLYVEMAVLRCYDLLQPG